MICRLLIGDPTADAAVPPSGVTGHLTILASAAMALLAVFAVMLALSAGRVADRWSVAVQGRATLELPDQDPEVVLRAQVLLAQTPGILEVALQDPADTRNQLAGWVNDPASLDGLALPVLIDIVEEADFEPAGLVGRLEGELPGAIYHRHQIWQTRVTDAVHRIRWLALGVLGLTFAVTTIVVTLAARASLAMNRPVVGTLRQMGAADSFVARAFVRRFTRRGLLGSALGTCVGLGLIALLPLGLDDQVFGSLRPGSIAGWLAALAIPPLTGLTAFIATRRAAFRVLRRHL
ncbi:MAG: FtsX-like permease family protein [Pseudomonadota bacterium]